MNGTDTKRLGQQGMVSFMVTLIMMLVITLIVIGFSQVTRRNAREALDRQLSAQAFYAAESGVNVTKATITNFVASNGAAALHAKTSCPNDYDPADSNGNGSAISPLSSTDTTVEYRCVLVNPNPKSLVFDISQLNSVVSPISASGAGILKTLTFNWKKEAGKIDTPSGCSVGSATSFPALANWACGYGVLRVDLMASPNLPSYTNTSLDANTVTLFMTPFGGGGGQIPASGGSINFGGPKVYVGSGAGCTTGNCKVTVTLPGTASSYYVRLTSMYREATNTVVSGTVTAGGGTATFTGSQAVIDVTGRAEDQVRRVQARIGLSATGSDIPSSAVASSNSICKYFTVLPSGTVDLGPAAAACN